MNFIAMDFETANSDPHSACALGLVFVKNNQLVADYYSLIQPESPFSPANIRVHGIRPQDVQAAPKFPELWTILQPVFENSPLMVAHNMPFDYKVLASTLAYYGLSTPRFKSCDTVRTSRALLKGRVKNNKLNTLADYYQIPLNHHDALDDAKACAKILIYQNQEFGDDAIRPFVRY